MITTAKCSMCDCHFFVLRELADIFVKLSASWIEIRCPNCKNKHHIELDINGHPIKNKNMGGLND